MEKIDSLYDVEAIKKEHDEVMDLIKSTKTAQETDIRMKCLEEANKTYGTTMGSNQTYVLNAAMAYYSWIVKGN